MYFLDLDLEKESWASLVLGYEVNGATELLKDKIWDNKTHAYTLSVYAILNVLIEELEKFAAEPFLDSSAWVCDRYLKGVSEEVIFLDILD